MYGTQQAAQEHSSAFAGQVVIMFGEQSVALHT